MPQTKDKRITLNHQRIEHEGEVWHIDAKIDPNTKTMKVYRVYGDITNPAKYNEAIDAWLNAKLISL